MIARVAAIVDQPVFQLRPTQPGIEPAGLFAFEYTSSVVADLHIRLYFEVDFADRLLTLVALKDELRP
jgi:hypothetical protein